MARRGYRSLYPQGRSAIKQALYNDACDGCGGPIKAGDDVQFDNVPRPKSIYHPGCPSRYPDASGGTTERPADSAPEAIDLDAETARAEPTIDPAKLLEMVENAVEAALEKQGDASKAVAKALEKALDEGTVKRLVEAVTPKKVILEVKTSPKGKGVEVEGAHFMLERCLRLIEQGFHLYLWGPAGSGKTTLAFQIAEALKLEAEIEILTGDTSRPMLFGFRSPDGKKMETALTRCTSQGKVLVLDECDLGTGRVQTTLNAVLAQRRFQAAWGEITCHEKFIFIATGNTPGAPTKDYPDRQRMSEAFKDRLYFVYVPIDWNIVNRECGLPEDWTPPARRGKTPTPQAWGTWVKGVYEWLKANPLLTIGTRAAINGVKAIKAGETAEEMAHALFFRGADAALVAKVLNANPLP